MTSLILPWRLRVRLREPYSLVVPVLLSPVGYRGASNRAAKGGHEWLQTAPVSIRPASSHERHTYKCHIVHVSPPVDRLTLRATSPELTPNAQRCPAMLHWTYASPLILLATCLGSLAFPITPGTQSVLDVKRKDAKVLILGGGVAGVIAARTLHEQGIDDFMIIEARPELGGRMMSREFGAAGNRWMVELGANWVQGTQTGNGPANPIWELAEKHNISMHSSEFFGSVGECLSWSELAFITDTLLPQRRTTTRGHPILKTSFKNRSRTLTS